MPIAIVGIGWSLDVSAEEGEESAVGDTVGWVEAVCNAYQLASGSKTVPTFSLVTSDFY